MLADSAIYINSMYLSLTDLLNDSISHIPFHIGLGINDTLMERYQVTPPAQALVFPAGDYLVTLIKIQSFEGLEREKIAPLLNFAKEKGYEITGGITSFLAYIDQTNDSFFYRIRIPVKKNS